MTLNPQVNLTAIKNIDYYSDVVYLHNLKNQPFINHLKTGSRGVAKWM